jgi:F0F1-type ATP synthase membrane subunit b/b'
MSILRELGVNQTIWIQLALFFICYLSLSQLVFKPYLRNLNYRKQNTGGSFDQAAALNAETEKLALEYQHRMKEQNAAAQAVYDKLKGEGQAEEDRLIQVSRKLGQDVVEQSKKKVASELGAAQLKLKSEIPHLSELIASRVLGREIS